MTNRTRETTPLNDGWLYLPSYQDGMERANADEAGFSPVRLPHANVELPFNYFNEKEFQFISCYRRHIRIAPRAGRRVFLHFEGVMAAAKVFFNGAFLTEHLGGYTPFSCELTGLVTGGEDVLAVVVDSRERDDIPPFGYVIDYLTFGGIYREVWLEETNEVLIQNAHAGTAKTKEGWRVELDLFLDNPGGGSGSAELEISLSGAEGAIRQHRKMIDLTGEKTQKITASFDAGDVRLWGLNAPNLYDLTITLQPEGRAADEYAFRIGFREAKFTPEGFVLNGKNVKLRGLNRHQIYPYVGNAMPRRAQESDAELLKHDLGVNFVRTSHYPQSKHFLNRCDELGLLVFEELPGWQHIGGDAWKKNAVSALEEMIRRDWNHPAIVLWGVRINESPDDDPFYEETNARARELDPTRQTGGVRNFAGSRFLEDVYTYNDFVHDGRSVPLEQPGQITRARVPYLVTEHNGHMFPTKKFDNEEKRVEHALRHLRVLDVMYGSEQISGAVGWCMSDYNTHKDFGSGDLICYHGVTDMFRLPKSAAAAYRSQQDEDVVMEVASGMHQGERTKSLIDSVHIFTNCDSVRLYKDGAYIGTYLPDRASFPKLPHPPVVITDFIGGLLTQNEGLSGRDAERVKRLFAAVIRYGDRALPLRYKLIMGYIMLKYRYSYNDAADLFVRYVAIWGSESAEFLFEGYIGERLAATVRRGMAHETRLKVTPQTLTLIERDTYDVCRVAVEHIDQFGAVMPYSTETIRITVSGAGERIGPEMVPLTGGSAAFWVKSTGEGEIHISIESSRTQKHELKLTVTRCAE